MGKPLMISCAYNKLVCVIEKVMKNALFTTLRTRAIIIVLCDDLFGWLILHISYMDVAVIISISFYKCYQHVEQ